MLRNLRDFGFGKASMESMIQDEVAKLCTKLSELPKVRLKNKADLKHCVSK